LENLIISVAVAAVLLGACLYAYGVTLAIVDGPGYKFPNMQHISTTPNPARS